jgi:hypothetical protein
MKPEHICANHPTEVANAPCNHCGDWFCSRCLIEGPKNSYCGKRECLKQLVIEKGLPVVICPSCGTTVKPEAEQCSYCGEKRLLKNEIEKPGCYSQYVKVVALFWVVFGCIVLIHNIWLVSIGVKTKGTILNAHSNFILSKRPNWELKVKFYSEKDKKDIAAEMTDRSFAFRKENDSIDLLYDPDYPMNVKVDNIYNLWYYAIWIGALSLFIMAIHYYFNRLLRDDENDQTASVTRDL